MEVAEVIKLTFKVREIFPPDHPMSVPLLRLMAATNDVRQLMALLLIEDAAATPGSAKQLIQNGEVGYLLRMFCGHLFEAGLAFRELDAKCGQELNGLFSQIPGLLEDLKYIRMVYNDPSEDGFNKAVLNRIRTFGAFHYKHLRFNEYLRNAEDEAVFILAEYAGVSRYVVADNILTAYVLGLGVRKEIT